MANRMTRKKAAAVALRLAKAGIPAGPIAISWNESKGGTNKRPLTLHGHDSFTTDGRELVRLFNDAHPRADEVWGVGIAPGPAGYVVLDVDVKGGKDGGAALAELEAQHGTLPEHPVVLTASGGVHRWLRKAAGAYVGNQGLAEGVDIRSDAGWTVAPGVVTPWGSWALQNGHGLTDAPEAPEWVNARLNTTRPAEPAQGTGGTWTDLDRTQLHPGELAALEALEALGGHSPVRASDGTIRVTRPGKDYGTSAQISYNGPDVVQVFSSDWSGLPAGTYDAEQLTGKAEMVAMLDGGTGGTSQSGGGIDARLDALGVTDLLVRKHARDEWARGEARKLVRRLDGGPIDPPGGSSLADLLAEPDEETAWRVNGLIPAGANVLLVAQAKSGKTTLVNNLVKSVADWRSFLTEDVEGVGDLGEVAPLMDDERVMIIDLELDRRTIRRWLRDQAIANTDRVMVESLRGRTGVLDVRDVERRAAWAKYLAEHHVKILVIDCLGPLLAYYGADENSNTEVGQLLAALEALKRQAGVEELILVHHAGHSGERARGASRLRDWPDAEIRLMIEGSEDPRYEPAPDAPRYIAARGRDVSLRERELKFNPATRRLSLAEDEGSRAQRRATAMERTVLERIEKNPGSTANDLTNKNGAAQRALTKLVQDGKVHTYPGKNRAVHHVLADECETPKKCLAAKAAMEAAGGGAPGAP